MKSISYSIISWTIILPVFFISCDKYERLENKYAKMIECHEENRLDSLKTMEAILGEWKWNYIYCYANAEEANGKDFDNLTVEFKSDNTVDVKEDGVITQTSQWKLLPGNVNYHSILGIETIPPVTQMSGRLVFCNKKLLFHQSYIDACDNYFKR